MVTKERSSDYKSSLATPTAPNQPVVGTSTNLIGILAEDIFLNLGDDGQTPIAHPSALV